MHQILNDSSELDHSLTSMAWLFNNSNVLHNKYIDTFVKYETRYAHDRVL